MRNVDQTLDAALHAEERELLRRIGDDPGHFEQVMALFSGRSGWINTVMMAAQLVLFAAGVWAGWNFFQATEALAALHWGLPAAVLLLMSLIIKLAMWPTVQANRVLLALKRIELLVAQSRQG
jgi:hypothetical protein